MGIGREREREREREISSEALSFPAAGSLKRQLVSPKRGRAGNNETVQVNNHLTLLCIGIFTSTMYTDSETKLH
jgi:hypothetical protein